MVNPGWITLRRLREAVGDAPTVEFESSRWTSLFDRGRIQCSVRCVGVLVSWSRCELLGNLHLTRLDEDETCRAWMSLDLW